jgi:dGTPase
MADGEESFYAPVDWLEHEERVLAPYAMRTRNSRGRRHEENPHPFRTLYQRDRDRIVHSTAFRRLMYKTQVLVAQTNDHHRTRLTHTLEVAQISRTIARQLGLNEDLTEAIALAHDLGHPPFGHAGEEALNDCMQAHGGFEHNAHGLRIVDHLEYRYADFPGLNLSWEVLESSAMHSKQRAQHELTALTAAGQPLLEAQLVDAADSLAYDTHDVDDALGVGLITPADLQAVEFWRRAEEEVRRRHRRLGSEQFQSTIVRYLIDWQVTDLLEQTRQRIHREKVRSVADVRGTAGPIVAPGPEVQRLKRALEEFLHEHVYRHYRVTRMARKGRRFLFELYGEFTRNVDLLPERYSRRVAGESLERVVCDYLAGMTDRFAQEEYLRLFHPYHSV